MATRIDRTVVHYSKNDPRSYRGGVESFARNLELIFERVEFMTPATRDEARVRRERLPVVCDNQMVLDWPDDIAVIGFQHGVARRKVLVTRSINDVKLALSQRRAARRKNVLWVACARWIADEFSRSTLCPSGRVIYHPVNLARFDGQLDNRGSKLVLHDARSLHKGRRLLERLARRVPDYRFEPLSCEPNQVPDRMRRALAFLHLSRYEGNSIVCNEAMAMNLPCLFTRVGLMLDGSEAFDVETLSVQRAYGDISDLATSVAAFLERAARGGFQPRHWVVQHAGHDVAVAGWRTLLDAYDALAGLRKA
jgi:hypothetical protein